MINIWFPTWINWEERLGEELSRSDWAVGKSMKVSQDCDNWDGKTCSPTVSSFPRQGIEKASWAPSCAHSLSLLLTACDRVPAILTSWQWRKYELKRTSSPRLSSECFMTEKWKLSTRWALAALCPCPTTVGLDKLGVLENISLTTQRCQSQERINSVPRKKWATPWEGPSTEQGFGGSCCSQEAQRGSRTLEART